jgi:osmotically inducible protein OsmC
MPRGASPPAPPCTSIPPPRGGPRINLIELRVEADVPGIDDATFQQHARQAKEGCPVSKALAATEITLEAHLAGG